MEEKLSLILFLDRKGKKGRQRRQYLDTGLLLLYCPPQLTIVLDQTRLQEILELKKIKFRQKKFKHIK